MSHVLSAKKKPRTTATKSRATSLLKAPTIAYPTLLLGVCAPLLFVAVALQGFLLKEPLLPMWLALFVNGALSFAAFTPMHDASHKSITRKKLPNEIIGRLCAVCLLGPFAAFRMLHLTHHKHTNHDHDDPDMWSGRGPWFVLPLRWLTQDFHYYAFYLARRKERPTWEVVETVATLAAYLAAIIALGASGHLLEALVYWVIPARLGLMLLAFGFDYLPHRPHDVTSREDRFQATVVRPVWWLTPVLLYQNYHLIHHLYPGIPFYRYAKVWRDREDKLCAQGAKVIHGFMDHTAG